VFQFLLFRWYFRRFVSSPSVLASRPGSARDFVSLDELLDRRLQLVF
jgi:hypothetical protein